MLHWMGEDKAILWLSHRAAIPRMSQPQSGISRGDPDAARTIAVLGLPVWDLGPKRTFVAVKARMFRLRLAVRSKYTPANGRALNAGDRPVAPGDAVARYAARWVVSVTPACA